MAFEIPILDLTYPAGQDLSGNQFRAVYFTQGAMYPCTATSPIMGIQQNDPSVVGSDCSVRVMGVSKMVLYGGSTAIAPQAAIAPNADAIGVVTTTDNDDIVGFLMPDNDTEIANDGFNIIGSVKVQTGRY